MIQEELLAEKERLINELQKALIRYNEVNNAIENQMVSIEEEVDSNNKKKFTNDLKRKEELKIRSADLLSEYDTLKINIEILRLHIKNLTQKIDFFNMKTS